MALFQREFQELSFRPSIICFWVVVQVLRDSEESLVSVQKQSNPGFVVPMVLHSSLYFLKSLQHFICSDVHESNTFFAGKLGSRTRRDPSTHLRLALIDSNWVTLEMWWYFDPVKRNNHTKGISYILNRYINWLHQNAPLAILVKIVKNLDGCQAYVWWAGMKVNENNKLGESCCSKRNRKIFRRFYINWEKEAGRQPPFGGKFSLVYSWWISQEINGRKLLPKRGCGTTSLGR